ncbi:DUF835 domain-containing protein [Thermococcus thioreducens]|uniref:DUF835 domain-containing protein n=1 Tax=Thermococcus thioreducens TaxID=277988 RepID=A0A0Q2M661_9EURY|nr:DUF835 domain-containing protein [Thermococcus thioreducens]ASJ11372.1 hypothetical protein A3L14_00050 [Thermococcus thioreducens]KQH83394.1 hypothetical protein AMR53_00050 [Thermococcus thioreducens]SEW07801.1 Protein of unknown function [Thermococcus thioreducens]
MELTVSLPVFIADVVLFVVIGYAALYALKRINRYEGALNRFIVVTAFSLFLASIGRAVDIVDDFVRDSGMLMHVEQIAYFFSILGITYGLMNYIRSVERRIFPVPSGKALDGKLPSGGFMYLGGEDEVLGFLGRCGIPAMVITRSPWKYEGSCKHVQTLWITQASESGVGPTKLHVILDSAVKFFQGGGKLVVIDCLEVLILYNDFQSVFRFLSALKDYAIGTGSTVLLLVGSSTMDEKEMMILKREFAPIKDLKELLKTSP